MFNPTSISIQLRLKIVKCLLDLGFFLFEKFRIDYEYLPFRKSQNEEKMSSSVKRSLTTRAVQTDQFSSTASDDKAYFRIIFGEQTLQFKLPLSSPLIVMFAKVPVKGDFVWHGITLDETLAPFHYNMLPGEENCATLHVVSNHKRSRTYAEDVLVNDTVRSVNLRLRIQEEENEKLKVEMDDLRAQIFVLQRELANVEDIAAKRIEEERVKRDMTNEEKATLEAAFKRLEAEHEVVKKQSLRRLGLERTHVPAAEAETPQRRTSVKPAAASMEQLKSDLSVWKSNQTPLANASSTAPVAQFQSVAAAATSAPQLAVNVVFMDEAAQKEVELPPLVLPNSVTSRGTPCTLSIVLQELAKQQPSVIPPVNRCMICVKSSSSKEYTVLDIQQPEVLNTIINHNDTLYVAKMVSL